MISLATIAAAAACAAGAFDAGTTIAGRDMKELNPMLSSNGHPAVVRLVALDAIGCAGSIAIRHRKHALAVNLSLAGLKIILGASNLHQLAQQQPGLPIDH